MEEIEFLKLMGAFLGASGIGRLIELLIKWRFDKRLKLAETKNLNTQAETQIIDNWIQWSQHLESRVKELEVVARENSTLKDTVKSQQEMIDTQHAQITKLETKVRSLEKKNSYLKYQLSKLSPKDTDNG